MIDDEPGVLRVACLALEAGGYIVAAYADGRGGIGARVIETASRVKPGRATLSQKGRTEASDERKPNGGDCGI